MYINDRVARGIGLLNLKRPGWETEKDKNGNYLINLDSLDMDYSTLCVLGQLYRRGPLSSSGYAYGGKVLGISKVRGDYGFDGDADMWIQHINSKRALLGTETVGSVDQTNEDVIKMLLTEASTASKETRDALLRIVNSLS